MQFKTVGESLNALSTINGILQSGHELSDELIFNKLGDTTKDFSIEALKMAISQSTLNEEYIKSILSQKGLKGDILETTVAELAQITTNNALSASQAGATTTTLGLGSAIKGLWATLQANPLLLVATTVTAGITIWQNYKQSVEEAVLTASEAADVYSQQSSSIDEAVAKYQSLREQLIAAKGNDEETYNIKQQLLGLQTELNEQFGDEYGKLNLITDAYKDQTNAIKTLSKEAADTFLYTDENKKGIEVATTEMTKEQDYTLSDAGNISLDTLEGKELKQIVASYSDEGMDFVESTDGTVQIHLYADAQDAYDVIHSFENDVRAKAKELGNEHLFDGILNTSSNSLNDAKDTIEEYGPLYEQAQLAQIASDDSLSTGYNEAVSAVEAYNEAVLKSEDLYNDESVKYAWNYMQTVKQGIQENKTQWGHYSDIMDNVFASANDKVYSFYHTLQNDKAIAALADNLNGLSDTELQAMADDGNNGDAFDTLYEQAKEYGLEVQEVIDLLTELGIVEGRVTDEASNTDTIISFDTSTTIEKLSTLEDSMSSLNNCYSTLFEGSKVDLSSLDSIRESFSGLENVDMSVVNDALEQIANADSMEEAQSAMNSLSMEYLNASGILEGLNEENKDFIASTLESIGFTNAEELVTGRLAAQEAFLAEKKNNSAIASDSLSNATFNEIAAIIAEGNASATARAYLAQLAFEKSNLSSYSIDTKSDIDAIIALANAAGASSEYVSGLWQSFIHLQYAPETAKNRFWDTYRKNTGLHLNASDYYAGGTTTPSTTSSSTGSNTLKEEETPETFDFINTQIEKQEQAYDRLKEKAENTFLSITKRVTNYASAMAEAGKQITAQTNAYNVYMAKANSFGLSENWAALVRDGSINLSEISDETLKQQIRNYQTWYEKAKSCKDAISGITQAIRENAQASAELSAENAQLKIEKLDASNEKTDARLETASTSFQKNRLISRKVKNIDSRQTALAGAYETSSANRKSYGDKIQGAGSEHVLNSTYPEYFTKAKSAVKSEKLIPQPLLGSIESAILNTSGAEQQAFINLFTLCSNYNANRQAEKENAEVYVLYALTAQQEKAGLRQKQLQNNLDKNQTNADRWTLRIADSTRAKNHNINTGVRKSRADASSYTTARRTARNDRKKAGNEAGFSYKNATGKLKKRLDAAISAIRSGKSISSDGLKAVKEYCNTYLEGDFTYYYNCKAYNEAVQNELSAKDAETLAKAESYAVRKQAILDKAQNTVEGRNEKNELYSLKSANAVTATGKNAQIDKQIRNIGRNQDTYRNIYKQASTDYKSSKKAVAATTSKGKSKQKIINDIKSKYTGKNKLIPAKYIIKAYTVSNAFGLACEKYNTDLETKNTAKETRDFYKETSKQEKADLTMGKFNNVAAKYDNQISSANQKETSINNQIALAEAKGGRVSTEYYNDLTETKTAERDNLIGKREALQKVFNKGIANGTIQKGSEEWYKMVEAINETSNAIDDAALALQEYENTKRQIEWDAFDDSMESIKRVNSESDYYIDLMGNDKLVDEDTGEFTDKGNATLALRNVNYKNYLSQAQEYMDEYNRILNSGDTSDTAVKRMQKLQDNYRDCQLAAEGELDAIKALIEEGYQAQLDSLGSLIDKYKTLRDSEKSAYDYQKTISQKTKNIASLQKQLIALGSNDTEEAKAKIQKLQLELKEAEEDLQETGYTKYISDTNDMLDEMMSEYEQYIDTKTATIDTDLQNIINGLGDTGVIAKTLGTVDANLSELLQGLIRGDITTDDNANATVEQGQNDTKKPVNTSSSYDTEDNTHGAQEQFSANKAAADSVSGAIKKIGNVTLSDAKKIEAARKAYDSLTKDQKGLVENYSDLTYAEGVLKEKQKTYAQNYIKKNAVATRKNKQQFKAVNQKIYDYTKGKVLSVAKLKELAQKLNLGEITNYGENGRLYKKLKALGLKGFKSGSPNIPRDQLAWTQENGTEIIYRSSDNAMLTPLGKGDKVWTAEMSENLWQLAQGNMAVPDYIQAMTLHTPEIVSTQNMCGVNIDFGDIHMYGVNDPEAFAKELNKNLANNLQTIRLVQNQTIGALSQNYNSLSGRRF